MDDTEESSRALRRRLLLVVLEKVCKQAYAKATIRSLQLWKQHVKISSRENIQQKVHAMQQQAHQQAQEIAQYKRALLRQRERLLQMASAWSEQQAEHSVVSAEADEILRLEQERVAETYMASKSKIDNLESAMASQEMAVQKAESKLRDVEGMVLDCICHGCFFINMRVHVWLDVGWA